MKNPADMTDLQLFKWARKTARSINSAAYRTNGMPDSVLSLVDRYQELRDELCTRELWYRYCKEYGLDTTHNGYDCAA